jgi:hypothetical protein
MTANAITVRRILAESFDDSQVATILDLLTKSGVVATEVGDKLHAAAIARNNALETEARRTCHRLGLPISAAGEVSHADVARCLAGAKVDKRMRIKTMLAQAGMLS